MQDQLRLVETTMQLAHIVLGQMAAVQRGMQALLLCERRLL